MHGLMYHAVYVFSDEGVCGEGVTAVKEQVAMVEGEATVVEG